MLLLYVFLPVAGFMILLITVALWEKQPAISLGQPTTLHSLLSNDYLTHRSSLMLKLGYSFSSHRHVKDNVNLIVGLSPKRDVLVVASEGKVAGIPHQQTRIYCRANDGMKYVTSDQFDSGDQSGQVKTKLVINADLSALLQKHRAWIEKIDVNPICFEEDSPADVLDALDLAITEATINRSRGYWVEQDVSWRYSILGVLFLCIGFFKQLGVGLTQIHRVLASQ